MRMQLQDKAQWHSWFAWHPISTKNRQWIWLETVQRRWDSESDFRLIDACDPGEYVGGWEYQTNKENGK